MLLRLIQALTRPILMKNPPSCGHTACAACCMGMLCNVHGCNGGKTG